MVVFIMFECACAIVCGCVFVCFNVLFFCVCVFMYLIVCLLCVFYVCVP